MKVCWNMEARKTYRERTEEIGWRKEEGEEGEIWTIEKTWERLKELIKEALLYTKVKKRIKEIGFKAWWDRSCTKKKREVKRIYKKWKKGKGTREKFLEERKKLREYLESKRRKKRGEEKKELRDLKNEAEVWKYMNKKRRKKEWK